LSTGTAQIGAYVEISLRVTVFVLDAAASIALPESFGDFEVVAKSLMGRLPSPEIGEA